MKIEYVHLCIKLVKMMLYWLFQIFVVLFFSNSAWSNTTFGYFFGGGGDVSKKETIFFGDLEKFSAVSTKKNWSTQYVHNGGHSEDDAWLRKNAPGKATNFSASKFDDTIDEIKKKITDKKIKKNDQLLIFIATHGEEKVQGQSGHEVLTVDGAINTLSRNLIEMRDLAEKNDIKLAIVDNSCHSGPTLDLGTDKTCVVTMASDDVAYVGDSFRFLEAMNSEENLEEAFLKSRFVENAHVQPGQPQISTESGRQVGRIMSSFSEDLNDYFDSKEPVFDSSNCQKRSNNIADIEKLLAKINSTAPLFSDSQIKAYAKELKGYRDLENEAIGMFNKTRNLDKQVCFNLSSGFKSCLNFSELEFNESFNQGEIDKKKDPYGVSQETLANLKRIKASDQYKKYKGETEKMKQKGRKVYEQSKEISKIEREIYSKLYSQLSQRNGKEKNNPCRDFKL